MPREFTTWRPESARNDPGKQGKTGVNPGTPGRVESRVQLLDFIGNTLRKYWRRGSGSNRRIKVLQTFALPLGYRADQ